MCTKKYDIQTTKINKDSDKKTVLKRKGWIQGANLINFILQKMIRATKEPRKRAELELWRVLEPKGEDDFQKGEMIE